MNVSFQTFKFIWIPRIVMIVFIVFVSMFSLDVFSGNAPFVDKLAGFLIHMIPSFVLILLLVLTWNRPLAAGYLFIIMGIIFTFYFKTYDQLVSLLTISLVPILTGLLFFVPSIIKKNKAD